MALPRELKKSMSNNGLDHLTFLEGERLMVYRDSANIPTVGIGHKVLPADDLEVGDMITPAQVRTFLISDLAEAEAAVNNLVVVPLNQNQFDALVSFVFNVGRTNFKSSTLLSKLNQYDYQGALAEFERWRYSTDAHTGVKDVDDVLVRRRAYEQNLFVA